ncbi:MAG: antibiotic biosynthesis monooxygenase [Lachnospiraceae bacterium]|nr:antibiotic biosynthesis monooxygenase [Lachnospiraceae bacterium]
MLIATVKAKVKEGTGAQYLEIVKKYSAAAVKAKGCVEHLAMPTYNADEFFQYELWESAEDLSAFVATQDAKDFQEARKDIFLAETKLVRKFDATQI